MQRILGVVIMSTLVLSACKEDLELAAKEQVEENCSINAYGKGSCVFRNTSEYELEKCVTVRVERISGYDCTYKEKGALGTDFTFVDEDCSNANINNLMLLLESNGIVSEPVCSGPIEPRGVVERTVMGFSESPISICNPWPESCNISVEFAKNN